MEKACGGGSILASNNFYITPAMFVVADIITNTIRRSRSSYTAISKKISIERKNVLTGLKKRVKG
jgi:hypothetical protein